MLTEALILAFTLIFLYFLQSMRRHKNYPPGPFRLPIIGNLLTLESEEPSHIIFTKLRNTYGDIFSIDFGSRRAVVLNDYKSIRDALNQPEFSGRPRMSVIIERSGGIPRGLIHTDGPKWAELRRMVLKNLRDFGFGKQTMEGVVQEEIKELISNFEKEIGNPISTQNRFNAAVLNVLWSIITGRRFNHDDARLKDLVGRLTSNFKKSKNTGFTTAFPWLVTSLPRLSGWKNILNNFKVIMGTMQENIDEHKKTIQEGDARDFLDVCLQEISNTSDPASVFYGEEAENNLRVLLFDLFAAGAETTSTSLTWAFLLLALHPESQEKLCLEIESIIGNSRMPSLSDKPNMPYAQAVILEAQRYASIAPLSVFHRTLEDVPDFYGFFIPKDTIVIPNLYSAMRDPKVWTDPESFKPERFISDDGQTLIVPEAFIPFGIGKRVCIGQSLAKVELFLLVTSLFQRFKVSTVENESKATIEYSSGTVLILKPHQLVLTERTSVKKN